MNGKIHQQVQIAKALATNPPLLFLDKITTGLILSVQAAILDLILEIQHEWSQCGGKWFHGLCRRGRENKEQIDKHIRRSARFDSITHPGLIRIDNSGPLHRTGEQMIRLLAEPVRC